MEKFTVYAGPQLLGLGMATIKRVYEELIEKGFIRLEQEEIGITVELMSGN